MEAILVDMQQQDQCSSHGLLQISETIMSTPPLHGFRGINCRTNHYGIVTPPFPTPAQTTSYQESKSPFLYSEPAKYSKRSRPVDLKRAFSLKDDAFDDDVASAELFAGPAFSNSPPPSSLPIPKFSLRQNRSYSLELPVPKTQVVLGQHAKSAPSSPKKGSYSISLLETAIATENLRKILHLDLTN